MSEPTFEIEIHKDAVATYYCDSIKLAGLFMFVVGYFIALIYLNLFGDDFSKRSANELRYWVEDGYIRIKSGVWFKSEKSIPLDKVTDFVLVEGPLMRRCAIQGIRIQTAGMGSQMPEGMLYGPVNPESVRDRLVELRNRAVWRPVPGSTA